jgi:amino acid permease
MDTATNSSVIVNDSPAARRAGMSESEWREAIKFDSTDTGWVIMSIGMAIGAGIVFLPVQVGLMGLWVFLLSSIIGYPPCIYSSGCLLTRWQNPRNAKTTRA